MVNARALVLGRKSQKPFSAENVRVLSDFRLKAFRRVNINCSHPHIFFAFNNRQFHFFQFQNILQAVGSIQIGFCLPFIKT